MVVPGLCNHVLRKGETPDCAQAMTDSLAYSESSKLIGSVDK